MIDANQSIVQNSLISAAAFGPGMAVLCAVGAEIYRAADIKDNIVAEAVTVLVGGTIAGATIGALTSYLPNASESSYLYMNIYKAILALAAVLIAPWLGENILHCKTEYSSIMLDGLTGAVAIAGSVAGICSVVLTAFAVASVGYQKISECYSCLFGARGVDSSGEKSPLLPEVKKTVVYTA